MAVNYFYFESLGNGNTISMDGHPAASNVIVYYSTDGSNFTRWTVNTPSSGNKYTSTQTVNSGTKFYMYGSNTRFSTREGYDWKFKIKGRFKIGGDIRTLLSRTNTGLTEAPTYAFEGLFWGCTGITEVSEGLLSGLTTLNERCYRNMFYGCSNLTNAPALPATTLAEDCYNGMFYSCTSLTTAPTLPATTLAGHCYYAMFAECSGLTTAPELPATTLAENCYAIMFRNCRSLTEAPTLAATTLANWCYKGMFQGCVNITEPPELPATTLAYGCYNEMFNGCTSLETPPALPATGLTGSCYASMFQNCTSLAIVPTLPATTLDYDCYYRMFKGCTNITVAPTLPAPSFPDSYYNGVYSEMFSGCTKLEYIECLAVAQDTSENTSNWVAGVADSGTFVKAPNMYNWSRGVNGIPVNWNVENATGYTGYTNYIVFTPISNNCTVSLTKVGSPTQTAPQLVYSTDGEVWYDWDYSSISLGASKLYICAKSSNAGFGDPNDGSKYYKFTTTGTFDLGGDIRALINRDASGTTVPSNRCFIHLFEETGVVNVDSDFLSGYTTLTNRCYARLFYGCTSLVTAPEIPATTVGEASCIEMFRGCTSLIEAPELPAKTLAYASYAQMFQGCTSLTTAPSILPATALTESCYKNMFQGATALTKSPILPAKTLATNSYATMFSGATSLNYIKCLATDISASNCTQDWVNNVANSGTFVKHESMTGWTSGNNGIPTNWTIEDSGMKIQFRKYGQTNWVDSYPIDLPIAASGGSVIYEVKYTYETSNYRTGHYTVPTGWSIVDGWSTQGSSYKIQQYTINYPASTGSTPASARISFFLSDNGETIINSIPLLADGIYTSYLYVGESGSTTTTMEASWEGEHDSDFKTYYWQENIDSFAFSTDVDWITNIWADDEDEEIGCYVEPNYGLAPRTGTITVVGTDTIGRTHTCTIVINQGWNVRYPIWQDVYFTGATDTLDYYIAMDTGSASREIIYQGKAYLQPNQSNVKINISKICQNYLSNNIEDGNTIRNLDSININTMKLFYIFNASGDTELETYRYVYDWSYGDISADGILTKPINGHADSRMVKLGTSVETSLYYHNHSIPNIYTSGYCGDYAIYYLQRNGGWAAFLIEGNSKKTDRYEKYSYNMAFDNNKAMFEENIYHNQITAEWQMSTGWLTDEQAENLAFNLIPSNRVFLHDLKKDKIIPVIVSNDSIDYKTFKNTGRQLVRYDITLTESQKKQML